MPKFGDYTASTAPNSGDLLLIKDVVSNSTKKITRSNLLVGTALPTNTVTTAAITDSSVTAAKLATGAIKLGYTQITSNFTTSSTTAVQVTGLTSTVTVPAGGRGVKITAYCPLVQLGGSPKTAQMEIWDGTVGSGTRLTYTYMLTGSTNIGNGMQAIAFVTPSAGSKTYNVGLISDIAGGTLATFNAAATAPAFILVEAI